MYSETLHSFIPYATSQGFIWEVFIDETLGLKDQVVQRINDVILSRIEDEIALTDDLNKSIRKILEDEIELEDEWSYKIQFFSSEVAGRRYRLSITGKKHE